MFCPVEKRKHFFAAKKNGGRVKFDKDIRCSQQESNISNIEKRLKGCLNFYFLEFKRKAMANRK